MIQQSDVDLVQNSLSWALLDKDGLSRRFYDRLFKVSPKLKILFTSDQKKQRMMLMSVLAMIAKGLSDQEKLHPSLYLIGEQHANVGVKPEDYQMFFEVFIDTLLLSPENPRDTADEPVRQAWRNAFSVVGSAMKNATLNVGRDIRQIQV